MALHVAWPGMARNPTQRWVVEHIVEERHPVFARNPLPGHKSHSNRIAPLQIIARHRVGQAFSLQRTSVRFPSLQPAFQAFSQMPISFWNACPTLVSRLLICCGGTGSFACVLPAEPAFPATFQRDMRFLIMPKSPAFSVITIRPRQSDSLFSINFSETRVHRCSEPDVRRGHRDPDPRRLATRRCRVRDQPAPGQSSLDP